MVTIDGLAAGRAALAGGRWDEARAAFGASLEHGETAEALAGLAEALWWQCEARASVRYRERAFAAFRAAGDVPGASRAAIDLAITHLLNLGNDAAARGWLARAERLVARDPARPSPEQGWLWLMQGYVAGTPAEAHELTGRALAFARDTEDVDLELVALSDLGWALVQEGLVAEGFALLDEAMAGTLGGECRRRDTVVFASCTMLAACSLVGDLRRATQWCRAAEDFMDTYGCPFLRARCRAHYGGVLVEKGEWARAEAELGAALSMAEDAGPGARNEALTHLAHLRVQQGRLEDAEALLAQVDDPGAAAFGQAVLWLARGRPGPAARLLRRRLELLGDRPIELAAALGLLAEALVDEADLPGARAAADRLEALATDGRAARALALAHRARGRIAAAERDHDGAAAHLDRALACYAQLDLPLETARVRLDLARALARCEPEPAVAAAAGARASFVRLGAAADADAAAELLRSLGAPAPPGPREGGLLTRREEEVLALVARGLSNPEIAARLYISRKTVAHHVSSLLGKLGARTRAELIAHVAGTAGVAAPDRPG